MCIFVPQPCVCLLYITWINPCLSPAFSSVLRLLTSWGETVGVGGLQDLVSCGGERGGGREEDAPCLAHVCLIRAQIWARKFRVWRRGRRVQSLTTATSACCLYCHLSPLVLCCWQSFYSNFSSLSLFNTAELQGALSSGLTHVHPVCKVPYQCVAHYLHP